MSRDARPVLDYHEATKHSEQSVRGGGGLDWENQPLPFKIYRDLEPIPLVRPAPERAVPALAAISPPPAVAAQGPERVPDLASLSRLLALSAGVTKRRRHPGGEILFRAHPNTGALYHVDLYLVAGELPGLAPGVYHFGPHDFALRRLREGDFRGVLLEASGGSPDLARAPVVAAAASTWWRNAWKYRARAWRHVFWDGGTLLANLLAVAASDGLEPRAVLGFADPPVERLFGLDPRREGLVFLVPLGRTRRAPPAAREMPGLELAMLPLSKREIDYPPIREAQRASSLADGTEAAAWRSGLPVCEEPPATGPCHPLRPLAEAELPTEPLDRVIRRRGSTRAFDPRRAPSFAALSTALDRATRGVPADFLEPPGATLLELYLIVHAVEGLAPGSYRYRRRERALELLRPGSLRGEAGRLGLWQQLPADAAVDVYSLVDLAHVCGHFGSRGYRAAQLEGGVTGGRLYLAAYAQGFGATGLTFFDEEVTRFFSPQAQGLSVMFLVALGYPDRAALGLGRSE